jgi:molybdopterin converting factor small subunit
MGRTEESLVFEDIGSVADVWKIVSAGSPFPDRMLCAVNMECADAETPVSEGDEVAFFPPVTGG